MAEFSTGAACRVPKVADPAIAERRERQAALFELLRGQRGDALMRLHAIYEHPARCDRNFEALLIAGMIERIEGQLAECGADDPLRPVLESLRDFYLSEGP